MLYNVDFLLLPIIIAFVSIFLIDLPEELRKIFPFFIQIPQDTNPGLGL